LYSFKRKKDNKEIFEFYLLFFLSVVVIYKLPTIVGSFFQLLLLIAFWRSKRDYFWLAFVFVIQNFPGALFSRYTGDIQNTFSLLPTSPVGTLYFWMVFVMVAFAKALRRKAPYKLVVSENVKILAGYFLILIIAFGIYKWTAVTRTLLPWLFLFILPRLLQREDDFHRFFHLLFSFLFFVIATQIFQILYKVPLAKFFGGYNIVRVVDELEGVVRPGDGIFISYLSLFGSLYFLTYKKKIYRTNYLLIISGLSVFSIFITATRSWMISALFITGSYFFFIAHQKSNIIRKLSIPFILVVFIIQFVPVVGQQVDLALQRYETIQYLLKGDPTAGGTLKRLDVRRPRVLAKFYESPIVGWGYGNEARNYSDGHVGNENLLMHTGIFGYSLWLLLWFAFILKMKLLNNNLSNKNPYKNVPILFIIMLVGILIINASAQWFNYLLNFLSGFTFIFLFTFASFVYKKALRIERNYKNIGNIK